jgi:hypothetical protein
MTTMLPIALLLAFQAAPLQPAAPSASDTKLIRIYVEPVTRAEANETVDPDGMRRSVQDIAAALAGKKKTLTVVDSERDADLVVKVIERVVDTPKLVMGLGPRPGELLPMTGPSRLVTLRIALTSGRDSLEFKNKNRPVEAQEGWKVAAADVAGQIDKWAVARRDEILKRRAR